MAEITAKMVNELRQRTNAPMMDSKKALVDANGDMEKAVELLRERGAASADKKMSNEMKEGLIDGQITADGKLGVLLRLGCQTDFVARNEGFTKLMNDLLGLAIANPVNTPAELGTLKYPDGSGRTVEQVIKELVGGTIKENIGVTGLARFQTANGRVEKYVHHNKKVGSLVQLDGSADDAVKVLAGEIGMHIVGVPQVPLAIDRAGLDPAVLVKEKAAAAEGTEGKPANIIEKIVAGKLEKYFQEVALVDQPFVKEEKKRIKDLLADTGKATSATVTVARFARFKVGEI